MLERYIVCALCRLHQSDRSERYHDGPCRAAVNGGATIAFWGDQSRMATIAADWLAFDRAGRAGSLHSCEDGDWELFVWLNSTNAIRQSRSEFAERHWQGCTLLAAKFNRDWLVLQGLRG